MCEITERWAGTVDNRLQNLEDGQKELLEGLKALQKTIEIETAETIKFRTAITKDQSHLKEAVDDIQEKVKDMGNGSKYVTFSFIRDKFTIPIVLAGVTFFLFTMMPGLLVLIVLIVPKISEILSHFSP